MWAILENSLLPPPTHKRPLMAAITYWVLPIILSIVHTAHMNAEQFASVRWELRITQTELARRLRVHLSTVNKWERGVRRIPYVVALALQGMLDGQRGETR